MNNKIFITDIYWDRMYLHFKLEGENLGDYEFCLNTQKNKFSYPVKIDLDTNEIVINITNIQNKEMLCNSLWFLKYKNDNYELELAEYENQILEHEDELIECANEMLPNQYKILNDEKPNEKTYKPTLYNYVHVDIKTSYKLKEMDKVFRYSGNNYAYVVTFDIQKIHGELTGAINTTFMMKNHDPHKRYFNVEARTLKKRFKKWLIYHLELTLNGIYQIVARVTPKNGKRILLMSETRVPMGGNLKVLDNRLKERGLDKEFKITYFFKNTLTYSRPKIFLIWLKLAFVAGRQDYIFVDDFAPFFKYTNVYHKTKFIQVWHAGVGFKSVGLARFGENGSPHPYATPHRKYDYAIVGGEALRDVYAETFGMDRENCLPYGVMRIDGYMEKDRIESFKTTFYQEHPEFIGKKIILFAPTFRGNGQRSAYYPYETLNQDLIYDLCKDEYVFLIKMHPYVRKPIEIKEEYKDKIIDFTSFPDINQLFYVTEILITDYSSNIYEFALQGKPIISYAFDKVEYELLRSVHRTLDKYAPGKVCNTFEEVIESIKNEDFEIEKLHKFVNENFDHIEGLASDKIIDHILLKK